MAAKGGFGRCKDCAAEGITTRRPAPHPGPRCTTHHRRVKGQRKDAAWERRLWDTYSLTPEQYWAIYDAQGGRCYICRRATGATKRLSVDHDHFCCPGPTSCGRCVRGLICTTDNRWLGHIRDDPEAARRAADYLENPPARAVLGRLVRHREDDMTDLIGPKPEATEAPKHPTPWRADKSAGTVYDANGIPVVYVLLTSTVDVFQELAEALVEAVNVYYGGLGRLRDDSGNQREPRVFDGSEEPPADAKKLLAPDGRILERHTGGGWHWTTDWDGSYIGIPDDGRGWEWRTSFVRTNNIPLTEIID